MTQKLRWLAALALLLAFGAGAVRAEDEDEEIRPAVHSALELLPPPRPVASQPSQIVLAPAPVPAPPWASFVLPNSFPCPYPVPMPAGMAGCPSVPFAMPCPCAPGACPVPPGPWCALAGEAAPAQYVVAAKMVKGDDEDAEVTTCPRVLVSEGQTALIHLQGYETANAQGGIHMQMTVSKQGQGAHVELVMSEAHSRGGPSDLRAHTESTEARCNVAFGKPYKIDLKPGVRLEVTVTAEEREERAHTAACVGGCGGMSRDRTPLAENDDYSSPMDTVGEVVDCLCEVLSDAATSALGWAVSTENDAELPPPPVYLQQPPQFVAPTSVYAPTRELPTQQATAVCPAGCPLGCPRSESGCTQCAAVQVVQSAAPHGRRKIEVNEGATHWTAEADHITVRDDCLYELEGNVRAASHDATGRQSMVIEANKVRLLRKDGCLEVHVDGAGKSDIGD